MPWRFKIKRLQAMILTTSFYLQDGKLKSNANPVDLMWNRSESVSNATKPTARSQAILGLVNDISEVSYGTYQSNYTGEVKHAF